MRNKNKSYQTEEMQYIRSVLEGYKIAKVRLHGIEREMEKLKDASERLGSSLYGTTTSGSRNYNARYTKYINSLADLDAIYNEELQHVRAIMQETIDVINLCDDEKLRNILKARYIDCTTAYNLALELDVTENYIYIMCNKAIGQIAGKINKNDD